MKELPEREAASGDGALREFGYALPAGLVIFVHLLVALGALGGVLTGIGRQGYSMVTMYSMLTSVAALIMAVAGTVLCVHFWSRRSWWILGVPAVTIPGFVVAGMAYLYFNWGY